ncbi:substrate-binding domain-containing protein [Methylocapsa acidiphila]|uniref:substrate-binding domain-containing protein n=1 Tax=Methylocapsa acidiphila TaxID=133552 RepID=UPI000410DA95|nr:substrate-binding domain-containing protein [Methylocapsa acidiphila]
MRRLLFILALLLASPALAEEFITLASTTSTEQSGLFSAILPAFKQQSGLDVHVVAVGTGQALAIGARGDADALLVHDRQGEDKFVGDGHGIDRRDVMFNDFVLIGPTSDPAGVKGLKDAKEAMRKIAAAKAPFASRGDDSGTHRMELRLWKAAGVEVAQGAAPWRRETGSGMGPTLNLAAGLDAYVLADRATWANFKNRGTLEILSEGDPVLFNPYGSILVNPKLHSHVKAEAARRWHEWLTSPAGRAAIASYKINGEQVFFLPEAMAR